MWLSWDSFLTNCVLPLPAIPNTIRQTGWLCISKFVNFGAADDVALAELPAAVESSIFSSQLDAISDSYFKLEFYSWMQCFALLCNVRSSFWGYVLRLIWRFKKCHNIYFTVELTILPDNLAVISLVDWMFSKRNENPQVDLMERNAPTVIQNK